MCFSVILPLFYIILLTGPRVVRATEVVEVEVAVAAQALEHVAEAVEVAREDVVVPHVVEATEEHVK